MRISDWSSDVCSSDLCFMKIMRAGPIRRTAVRLMEIMRRPAVGRTLAVGLALLAILSGFLTYAVMTGKVPIIRSTTPNVLGLLLFDLIVLLLLGAVIAYRVVLLIASQRRQLAGSRLTVRLVMLFRVDAIVPTIVIATRPEGRQLGKKCVRK